MLKSLSLRTFALAAGLAFAGTPASAHPHVFVTVQSTIGYQDGAPKEVRHAWRFDDMFSAFAVQGLDTDNDGKLSPAELADLAKVNVTSLKEFDFFTFGKAGGKDVAFAAPENYWLEHDGTALTLHFTLPLAARPEGNGFRVEIYDPTYFVAFDLAETNPAALDGAPAGCRVDAERPPEDGAPATGDSKLSEDFFSNLNAGSAYGQQFANALVVRCGAEAEAFAAAEQAKSPPPPAPEPEGKSILDRVEQAQSIAEARPLEVLPSPGPAAASSGSPSALGAFGVVRPDGQMSNTPTTGLFGWITRQQSSFYREMSQALTASKADGSAFVLLALLSFAYGVFHAAGPGHGKAVISSYLVATGETLRRGLAISFAAAMAQAATAIIVVGVLAVLLGATSHAMGVATWWLEAGSYALIVGLGLVLLFRCGAALIASIRGTSAHAAHECGPGCNHSHAAEPSTLDGAFDWKRAASAVLAIGLRPCTGALLILVFALAQGMLWAGIAATFAMAIGTALTVAAIATFAVAAKGLALRLASNGSGTGAALLARGVEVVAGLAVLAFGLTLLIGLLSTGAPVS